MNKIVEMFKKFIKNIKEYANYLMKVNFKELGINVIILICILLLSTIAYLPAIIIRDLLFSFVLLLGNIGDFLRILINFLFDLAGTICFVFVFVYLFNKRFEDIEGLEKQIKEGTITTLKNEQGNEEMELPKTKKTK